jgi:hypothetical protein
MDYAVHLKHPVIGNPNTRFLETAFSRAFNNQDDALIDTGGHIADDDSPFDHQHTYEFSSREGACTFAREVQHIAANVQLVPLSVEIESVPAEL